MTNLRGFWDLMQIVRWGLFAGALVYIWNTTNTWALLSRKITIVHFVLIVLTTCVAVVFKHGTEVLRHKKTVSAFILLAFVNLPYLLLTEAGNTPLFVQLVSSASLLCLNAYLNRAIAKYWCAWWDRQ